LANNLKGNAMSSAPFQVYRHSGKFGIHGPLLALIGAVIIGFPLGVAYAYLIRWIPFIYVNVFASAGYGFVIGITTAWLLKFSKVRNTGIAVLTGLLTGFIALYFDWNGHIHAVFRGAPWFLYPGDIVGGMKQLYKDGSWGMRSGGNITGIPLAIVWVTEALIIAGITLLVAVGMVKSTPFCEDNQCWLDEEKKIDTLDRFVDPAQVELLKSGDLGPLAQAHRKPVGADKFTRLTLKHSPKCNVFCTVKVENVTLEYDKEGKASEKTEELTRDLVLPHTMFDLVAKFEHFQTSPPPVV
jgi:hypothetical protein